MAEQERQIVRTEVVRGLREPGSIFGIGLRQVAETTGAAPADPCERQVPGAERNVFDAATAAAGVPEEKIDDVNVVPPIEAVAGPKLRAGSEGQDVAHRSPRFRQAHGGCVRRAEGGVRVEEAHAHLCVRNRACERTVSVPGLVQIEGTRQVEVLADDQFTVGLGLVSETVLAGRSRSLKPDHWTTRDRSSVTRAEVATEID